MKSEMNKKKIDIKSNKIKNNRNFYVRYKPRVPGKPCTSHKNVGFLNLNAQQIHTAQKNKKLYCQGRARRKAPVFYCGF